MLNSYLPSPSSHPPPLSTPLLLQLPPPSTLLLPPPSSSLPPSLPPPSSTSSSTNLKLMKITLHRYRDYHWETFTTVLGWPTQGVWPKIPDGTDITCVDRSNYKHPGGYELLATGDDFGRLKIYRYPSIQKDSEFIICHGHTSYITGVKWGRRDDWLVSVGGEDNCLMVWRKKVE